MLKLESSYDRSIKYNFIKYREFDCMTMLIALA